MKKFSNNLWSLVFAMIGFVIGVQLVWALIRPFLPVIGGMILVVGIVWIIVALRRHYSDGDDNSLIRGR
jgi:tellurite resistance protein TehA-like permease